MEKFTFEEINLICCFKDSNTADIVANINATIPYMDKNMGYIAEQTIYKLKNYTNIDIQKLLTCEAADSNQ